jgi:hypothetical protein
MRRVILVGNSLFAETLQHLFGESAEVEVVDYVASVEQALSSIAAHSPDALIIADNSDAYLSAELFLPMHCGLSILYASLDGDQVKVFSSRRIKASQSELLSAIAALPDPWHSAHQELSIHTDETTGKGDERGLLVELS